MAVVHSQDSGYAVERRKFEAHHTEFGPPGRPYTYQEYPMRMYRATREADGGRVCEGQTAGDEHERRNLESRGFVSGGQGAAIAALEAQELEQSKLAAELNYEAKYRLSPKAAAEVEAAQAAAGARHLPMVPEAPVKRKRRTKAEMAAAGE